MKLSRKQKRNPLREYMAAAGIRRQHELASTLGLSGPTISLYLRGLRSFSPKTAMRVSQITGIPLESLFQ